MFNFQILKKVYFSILIIMAIFLFTNISFRPYNPLILIIFLELYLIFNEKKTILEYLYYETYNDLKRYGKIYIWFIIISILFSIYLIFGIRFIKTAPIFIIVLYSMSFILFYIILIFNKMEKEDDFGLTSFLINFAFFIVITILFFGIAYMQSDESNYLVYNNGTKIINLGTTMYFSSGTLFSSSYGDVIPIGTNFKVISLIEAILGILVIISSFTLGLDLLLKKKEQKKWKPIEKEALELISSKLWNLSLLIMYLFGDVLKLPRYKILKEQIFENQILKDRLYGKRRKTIIEQLAKEDITKLFQNANKKTHLIFKKIRNELDYHQEQLNNLELKYGTYLDPKIRLILINLENELTKLSLECGQPFLHGKKYFKDKLAHHSEQIWLQIKKAIDLGLIKK